MANYYSQGTLIAGGGVTLSQLKTICKYHGWRDNTTDGEAALTRFINDTICILSTLAPWPEYMKRDGTFATVASTDEYTLSNARIDRVGVVERENSTLPLTEISIEDWQHKKRTIGSTGTPMEYAVEKGLAGGASTVKLLLYPEPSGAEMLYYSYFRKPAEMSAGGDVADWPNARAWLISEALLSRLAAGKKDVAGFSLHSANFMQKVYKALGDARPSYIPIKVRPKYDNRDIRIRDTYWSFS
jgi:hypothetical protein